MDTLVICRDATASSLITTLLVAIEARKTGKAVGVLLTQEALAALVGKASFSWPRGLSGQELRYKMTDSGLDYSLPVSGKRQGRQLDPRSMLAMAVEANVTMYACPIWIKLLDAENELPKDLPTLTLQQTISLLENAETVVGSY